MLSRCANHFHPFYPENFCSSKIPRKWKKYSNAGKNVDQSQNFDQICEFFIGNCPLWLRSLHLCFEAWSWLRPAALPLAQELKSRNVPHGCNFINIIVLQLNFDNFQAFDDNFGFHETPMNPWLLFNFHFPSHKTCVFKCTADQFASLLSMEKCICCFLLLTGARVLSKVSHFKLNTRLQLTATGIGLAPDPSAL